MQEAGENERHRGHRWVWPGRFLNLWFGFVLEVCYQDTPLFRRLSHMRLVLKSYFVVSGDDMSSDIRALIIPPAVTYRDRLPRPPASRQTSSDHSRPRQSAGPWLGPCLMAINC
jgi:hypothetical protein